MNLARRSTTAIVWNATASLAGAAVLFVRSVLLARWLPVEVFGVYALAASIVTLSSIVTDMGVSSAFVHRSPESQDEQQAAAVHFSLKLILTSIWAIFLATGALIFAGDQTRTALLLITATTSANQLTSTPRIILVRRVVHRRLALIQFLGDLSTTLVAVVLAWRGATLWALLATNIASTAMGLAGLYVWRPVWRPRLAWSPTAMRYFLRFGSRVSLAALLAQALDRVDDLWTGLYLGKTALGFYSRAYTFATYPRQILAAPVNAVAGGAYAELAGDRARLSKAFFRINALLVRSGFLIAGLFALVAPEFIRLVLGIKWLPMLEAFRLMLVFTLFDPMKGTLANLLQIGVGKPHRVIQARLVQLAVLVIGLFGLGPRWGIAGVALAVDAMLVVGIALLLWMARADVDFSLARLLVVPGSAVVLGTVLARAAIMLPGVLGSDWRTATVKVLVFSCVYGMILLALERHQFSDMFSFLGRMYEQSPLGL